MVASTDRVPDTLRKAGASAGRIGASAWNIGAAGGRVGASVGNVGVAEVGTDASVRNVDITGSNGRAADGKALATDWKDDASPPGHEWSAVGAPASKRNDPGTRRRDHASKKRDLRDEEKRWRHYGKMDRAKVRQPRGIRLGLAKHQRFRPDLVRISHAPSTEGKQ
jgi:hypothetical protein